MDVGACQKCGAPLRYSDDYDAYYCPRCNEWRERRCSDPKCFYCSNRPERPLGNVADAWESLFRWGDRVQRATGFTAEDIERAIQEYRRERARR